MFNNTFLMSNLITPRLSLHMTQRIVVVVMITCECNASFWAGLKKSCQKEQDRQTVKPYILYMFLKSRSCETGRI